MPAQTVIKLRRDTAANWTTANPVLAAGEPALETDTFKVKFGDGTSSWSALSYFGNLESLNNIGDVVITSATTGQVLQYNGTDWVNSDVSISEVTGLTDALDGKAAVSHTHGMADLTAFQVASPTDGQLLKYNSENQRWENSGFAINELSDVNMSSLATGQVLQYDGQVWTNATPAAGGGETISSFLLMGA